MGKWMLSEKLAVRKPTVTRCCIPLSPCMMCSGTIIQFGIPRVVIGENKTFGGNEAFLQQYGVEIVIADDPDCIDLMERFINEKPELWAEDIAED